MRRLAAVLAAPLAMVTLSGCLRYSVRQEFATDRYPVSASSFLFGEDGRLLQGPGGGEEAKLAFLKGEEPLNPSGPRSVVESSDLGRMRSALPPGAGDLVRVKHVRVTRRVWHWLVGSLQKDIDFRESIESEVEQAGGEGMINFHPFVSYDAGRILSTMTFQIIPWYTYVGYEADIVKRR